MTILRYSILCIMAMIVVTNGLVDPSSKNGDKKPASASKEKTADEKIVPGQENLKVEDDEKTTNKAESAEKEGATKVSKSDEKLSGLETLKENCSYHSIIRSSFVHVATNGSHAQTNIVCHYTICRGPSGNVDESATIDVDGETRPMSALEIETYNNYTKAATVGDESDSSEELNANNVFSWKGILNLFEPFHAKILEQPCFCANCTTSLDVL